ncbi:hypothetical protein Tco_0104615 [Tanacetum coccineum]
MDSIISLGQKNTLAEYMILLLVLGQSYPSYVGTKNCFVVPVFSPGDDPIALISLSNGFSNRSGLQCNKFWGGKGKLPLSIRLRAMANRLWEIRQVDRLDLLNVTMPKVKGLWLGNALSLSDQGMQYDFQEFRSQEDIHSHNLLSQTEDLDTYDSDCDDLSNVQAVLMANISNYGSDVISEVQQDSMILSVIEQMSEQMINHVNNWEKANKEQNNETITAELERYKERVKTFEQRLNIDLSSREKMIDSQMDDMIREKLALKEQIDSLEQNLSKQIKEKESVLQTFVVFKNESKEKENKYTENEIDLEKKIKELDNIICKVGQSAQTKAQRIKPTLYDGVVMSNTHVGYAVMIDGRNIDLWK